MKRPNRSTSPQSAGAALAALVVLIAASCGGTTEPEQVPTTVAPPVPATEAAAPQTDLAPPAPESGQTDPAEPGTPPAPAPWAIDCTEETLELDAIAHVGDALAVGQTYTVTVDGEHATTFTAP